MRRVCAGCCLWIGAAASVCAAGPVTFLTPSGDRWHYPFNFSGGSRATGSCFGSTGNPGFTFNDRDGEMVVTWDTSTQIAPGQGADAYGIRSVRVTLTNEPDATWPIDTTADEWFTYDANQDGVDNGDHVPRGQPGDSDGESDDADPGRPIELFGAGFGPNYTLASWTENSFYIGSANAGNQARDPFPFVYLNDGPNVLHVEDNIKGLYNESFNVSRFTPQPWATGAPVSYAPNNQPVAFDVVFDLDLSLSGGAVRQYFQHQLDVGKAAIVVTSLTETTQQAASGYPSFYMKEAVGLIPGAKAPRLDITICAVVPSDLDRDCDVDGDDLAILASCRSGTGVSLLPAGCGSSDLDHDADVDQDDFGRFQRCYSGSGHDPTPGCDH